MLDLAVPTVDVDAPLLPEGTVVGGTYRIRGLLGRGGMSQVYEADDLLVRRRVALKLVDDRLSATALQHEAQALAAVRHPGLPIVYQLGVHEHGWFLAMERLWGLDLEQHLAAAPGHRLPIDDTIAILSATADILGAVHASGMAHRDLKPANVMLCSGPRVVLLDFGISVPEVMVADAELSGTPRYMAPEVILGAVKPGRAHLADIYSLGAVGYELLAGAPPFEAEHVLVLFEHQVWTAPPSLSAVRPDVPPALATLLEACLAKRPQDRPGSASEVIEALRAIGPTRPARGSGRIVVESEPKPYVSPVTRTGTAASR